jgi:hypothetical protein
MKALLCGLLFILANQVAANANSIDPSTGMGFKKFLQLHSRWEANDRKFTIDETIALAGGTGLYYGFLSTVIKESNTNAHEFPFKLPNNLTPAQITLIMSKFVQEHPEKLHMNTIELLYEGLTKAYPNPKYKAVNP